VILRVRPPVLGSTEKGSEKVPPFWERVWAAETSEPTAQRVTGKEQELRTLAEPAAETRGVVMARRAMARDLKDIFVVGIVVMFEGAEVIKIILRCGLRLKRE
jgi:hypothetical protein